MSLTNKIINDDQELIGKKIVAIDLYDPFPLGYIIVEGGEFICFEECDDGISFIEENHIKNKLIFNDKLRDLFLEHNCITKEEHENYKNFLNKKKEESQKRELEREYQKYLELKAKFEQNS